MPPIRSRAALSTHIIKPLHWRTLGRTDPSGQPALAWRHECCFAVRHHFAPPCFLGFTGMKERLLHFAEVASPRQLLLPGGLGILCLWSYWPTLETLAQRWAHDPQYSHGYLVPLFALALLWQRAAPRQDVALRPTWAGL